MREIITNGPVLMLFKVYNDFFLYKEGVYSRHPQAILYSQLNPYHAVLVLGWGRDLNGVDYWVIQIILYYL